jgi:hypothetical protein
MPYAQALLRTAAVLATAGALPLFAVAATPAPTQGPIQYLCGGVGEGSRQQLLAQAPNFNLGFWMVKGPRGAYLADVPVTIKKGNQIVAQFTAEGPVCYLKVPAGTYTIEGQHDGQVRTIKVRTGSKAYYLRW